MKRIESIYNAEVKNLVKLREASERKKQKRFVIEGEKEVRTALAYGVSIEKIFYCPHLFDLSSSDIDLSRQKVVEFSREAFDKVTYRGGRAAGMVAIGIGYGHSFGDINAEQETIIPVLEGVEKPGNLGAVIRTILAAGINCLIVNDHHGGIFNPNVLRSSLGGVFGVKIVEASREDTHDWLRQNGFRILTTSAHGKVPYTKIEASTADAFILGSEDKGVSDFWKEKGDHLINIPMQGEVSSLNISVAAGIIIYEALRKNNKL